MGLETATNAYLLAAVCPVTEQTKALVGPWINKEINRQAI
jgi:hypothetical protein